MNRPGSKLSSLSWLIVKFSLVGAGSVLVYAGVLIALRPLIVSTVALTATSYVVSAIFNYVLQSAFTFRTQAADLRPTLRYLLMQAVCMGINSTVMYILVDGFGHHIAYAQLTTTALVAGTSFVLSYLWVYDQRKKL
jgi:putative flippase GtrA